VGVFLRGLAECRGETLDHWEGFCLDDQEIGIDRYVPDPELLHYEDEHTQEVLVSHLLKSNCPITGQPDWASIRISYRGPRIDRQGLLRYIVSYRQHGGFHEHCVERIFVDLLNRCHPERLTVYARYTRRGGLDINPFRTNCGDPLPRNGRLARQ
jgi:7-cyano-7-deazaguanine reductase